MSSYDTAVLSYLFAAENERLLQIMRSTNIYEIDAFLRDAHPDDPKRLILKPRLIKMLREYIRKAHPADQRVKDFQEKIALLRKKPSTRMSFEEFNEQIR